MEWNGAPIEVGFSLTPLTNSFSAISKGYITIHLLVSEQKAKATIPKVVGNQASQQRTTSCLEKTDDMEGA